MSAHRYTKAIKYILDVVVGISLLVALLPFLAVIGITIKLNSPGPIFFKQQRVGLFGNLFTIYKFRTMVDDAVNIGAGLNILDNDPRITSIGKFLREWSLDELPQLINIAKGQMSFIGPRPTLKHQVDNYSLYQRKRLNMKPGITGWAQVNGRNNLTWEERIELDICYIDNWSLILDAKIFFKTFKVIFTKDSIYSDRGINYDFRGAPDSSENKK